jgi:hypothetical protein
MAIRKDIPVKAGTPVEQPSRTTLKNHSSDSVQRPSSSEYDSAFQNFMMFFLGKQNVDSIEKSVKSFLDDISSRFEVKSEEQLLAKGTLDTHDVLSADSSNSRIRDMRVGTVTDYESGRRSYLVGRALDNYIVNQGVVPRASDLPEQRKSTSFKLGTIGEVQSNLVSSIEKASKLTGVPSALIGAMAGIESGFGNNLYSPTGPLGTFQQSGSYRETNWKRYGSFIAQHVPEARAALADGKLTKDEMRQLAFNDDAAALMTGLAAAKFAKDYKLDLSKKENWGLVYAEHNSGRGSVNKLLKGGTTEQWIQDYNPAIYKGTNGSQDILNSYQSKMMTWTKNYEQLESKVALAAAPSSVKTASSLKMATLEPFPG